MSDLEQRVVDELRRRADVMTVPHPHVDALERDGEALQARMRRRVVLVAAAAVVTVLAIGPWLLSRDGSGPGPASPHPSGTPSSAPIPARTLDDLPQGKAPAVPYLQAGALHTQGAAIATSANVLLASGPTVLVGRAGGQGAHWWLLDDDQLANVEELDGVRGPRISPDGDLLAWTSYPDSRTTRVTAWDPRSRREVDHVDLDAAYAECCGGGQQVELAGIDANGTVYWHDDRHSPDVDAWTPGNGSPQRGPAPSDAILGPTAPVVALEDVLPNGTQTYGIAVERDGSVLVDAFTDPRRHYVLRCDPAGDRCERTLPPGRISSWVFPETS